MQKEDSQNRIYAAIDLKSFYASVECVERGLDPLTTNLVVADASRTEKTICLAVTPSLKAYGIPGRARLFEVVQRVQEVNALRRQNAPGKQFKGESSNAVELERSASLSVGYIVAQPRMALYMKYSTSIYQIYLKYVAPEDIHVYSVDEVFMDVTNYLATYQMTAYELTEKIIQEILNQTNITATAGIGTNLYLCKVAMDIMAKRVAPGKNGERIAEVDEKTYRTILWNHRPLKDFWRVGPGYAKKLEQCGLMTMGDIARCSIGGEQDYYNEELLYKMFGVNAELLIDHAWGWEPCTIADIKEYKPDNNSLGVGQVLPGPYTWEKARLIVKEMTETLVMDMVDKCLVTDQMVLNIGYDVKSLEDEQVQKNYHGQISTDRYGRKIPKHAHGTANLDRKTCSVRMITEAMTALFDRIADKNLLVRRIYVTAARVEKESDNTKEQQYEQLNLFSFMDENKEELEQKRKELEREKRMQKAVLEVKKKYGSNAIVKGMNLEEGARTIERNSQIGGHKA